MARASEPSPFNLYGGIYMSCNNANTSIGCTVNNCKHHCQSQNYCSLDKVMIGTHESDPTKCECVDCKSFEMK